MLSFYPLTMCSAKTCTDSLSNSSLFVIPIVAKSLVRSWCCLLFHEAFTVLSHFAFFFLVIYNSKVILQKIFFKKKKTPPNYRLEHMVFCLHAKIRVRGAQPITELSGCSWFSCSCQSPAEMCLIRVTKKGQRTKNRLDIQED